MSMEKYKIKEEKLLSWKKEVDIKTIETIKYVTQELRLDLNNDRQNIIEHCIHDLINNDKLCYIPSPDNIRIKNNRISILYLNEGQLFYDKKMYDKAWRSFTKSIVYAIPDTETLAMAYSNRSATLFEINMHYDALKDIENFYRINKGSDELKFSNEYRECKCHHFISNFELMKSKQVDKKNLKPNTFELNQTIPKIKLFKKNLQVPSLSDSTELNYSKEYGSYITAKKDIKVGEVIGAEYPFVSNVKQEFKYDICHYCQKQTWSSIPCDNCVFAVYCSVKCKDNAYINYHKIECQLIPQLLPYGIKDKNLLALRIMIIGIVEELTVNKISLKNKTTIFNEKTKGFFNDILRPDIQTSFVRMESSISHVTIDNNCVSIADCILMSYYLIKNSNCLPIDHDGFIGDLYKRIEFMSAVTFLDKAIRILMNNCHEIMMPSAEADNCQHHIGSAVIVPFSLFNHSCQPMVIVSRYNDNQFVMRASCPIKKGQQIFTNYGPLWYNWDIEKRQEYLNYFNFNCKCDACIYNWIIPVNKSKKSQKIIKKLDYIKTKIDNYTNADKSYHYLTENNSIITTKDIDNYSIIFHNYYEKIKINSSEAVEAAFLFADIIKFSQVPFVSLIYQTD